MIERPEDLSERAEVWVYFRTWRRGTIMRILRGGIAVATSPIGRRKPRTDAASVELYSVRGKGVTVRRPLVELIPWLSHHDNEHYWTSLPGQNREVAQEFARKFWESKGIILRS